MSTVSEIANSYSDIAFSVIGRVAFPKGELGKDKQNRYVALLIGAIDLSELG